MRNITKINDKDQPCGKGQNVKNLTVLVFNYIVHCG